MPHKRNPIASENLCGLARMVRANSLAGLENVALWHERDISHSSVERIAMPDSTILIDYMLARFTDLIKHLLVYPARMQRNLDLTGGLVYSQRLLLELIEGGAQRKDAYEAVQRNAMLAWEGARLPGKESVLADSGRAGGNKLPGGGGWHSGRAGFKELVGKDPLITKYLTHEQIESCFDPAHYLRHINTIYRRVFGMDERQGKRRMARTRKQRR